LAMHPSVLETYPISILVTILLIATVCYTGVAWSGRCQSVTSEALNR
jgi:hypothetical protein